MMDYRKVDATLAAALDEIKNAEEPTLAVLIYTAKWRDETATIFLNGIGVRVYSKDFATAAETTADGVKRAAIKQAEGVRQARILQAQGETEAIRLVNEAADKYFVGNSQLLKRRDNHESISLSRTGQTCLGRKTETYHKGGDGCDH